MSPGDAVPVMVGSATLVMSSPRTPLSLAGASVRLPGAARGAVSITRVNAPACDAGSLGACCTAVTS